MTKKETKEEIENMKFFKIKIHPEGIIEIFNSWDKSERYGIFISDLNQLEELREICKRMKQKLEEEKEE
jgi:hypothetical protein